MEDSIIIQLYWDRDEKAIGETDRKYGSYCFAIANNILSSREDSDECVNDTWLRAWNVIPPKKPEKFKAFLGKITRNLSFDKYKKANAAKRSSEMQLVLDELTECVSGRNTTDEELNYKMLGECINSFLKSLSKRERGIFLSRYFYAETVNKIAEKYGISSNNASAILSRTRTKLRKYLVEEGYEL